MNLIKFSDHSATFELRYDPRFRVTKDIWNWNLGIYVELARSSGVTHVRAEGEPGNGTTFHVYLPAMEGEPAKEPEPLSALLRGNEGVLFVDDEESIAALGKLMLERLGYEVEVRADPVEAVDLFRGDPERFHPVVTDTTMPKLTGNKMVRELRKIHPGVRVVICTGYSEHMDEEKAKKLGIHAYLRKPLDLRALAGTVRKVLDEK